MRSRLLALPIFILLGDVLFIALHFTVYEQFNLDAELTLPAFYQTTKLFIVAGVSLWLLKRYTTSRAEKISWGLLGVIFAYIAIDEWWQIHEQISGYTYILLSNFGVTLRFAAWIVAYLPLMLGAAFFLYLMYKTILQDKLLRQKRIHWFLLIGAICFALVPVMEVISTWDWQLESSFYPLLVAVEEGFELIGATSFLAFVFGVLSARRGSRKG